MPEKSEITLLVEEFKRYYDLKKRLEAELEEVTRLKAQWEEALLAKLDEEGIEKIKTGDGTFFTREETYASYDKEREEETFFWLNEKGYESLIKATINARTLASWSKEMEDQGVELPDFFKVSKKRRVGVRSK